LVNFAKLEANTIAIKPETIHIFNLLHEISFYAKNEINKHHKNIDVSFNCSNTNLQIITDKKLLLQIFTQLISNAIKFTLNGRIEIGCHLKNEQFEFYVLDTGIGIEKEKLSLVFNRFRILEDETTRTKPGMGIGLPITKRIIEKLNGHIWIESELHQGTTVFFTLPQAIEPSLSNKGKPTNELYPTTLYILENQNDIFYKIYSILKVEFNDIVRIKQVEDINPDKASMVILNSSTLNPSNINYLRNLQKTYPQIKLIHQSFNIPHFTTKSAIEGFTLLPQSYGQILPTIKSILKR